MEDEFSELIKELLQSINKSTFFGGGSFKITSYTDGSSFGSGNNKPPKTPRSGSDKDPKNYSKFQDFNIKYFVIDSPDNPEELLCYLYFKNVPTKYKLQRVLSKEVNANSHQVFLDLNPLYIKDTVTFEYNIIVDLYSYRFSTTDGNQLLILTFKKRN